MTIDGAIPESWEARLGDGGVLKLAPHKWLVPGFCEDYYDGDPDAAETVKEELDKIAGRQMHPGMPALNGPMTSQELQSAGEQVASAQGIDRWKGLMLVLLHHIRELPSPPELQPVLATAESYWSLGRGIPETLETAKGKCWNYLDGFETHRHPTNPGTRFARALLCVLEPLGDEDSQSGTSEWFAGVVWDIW
ncbi:hypothetical protein ARTHRO9V_1640048 [Arthrobacter sp. 9V]|uniref:hypothetical protein n=1 Tax=Arthrobacter sp. 9V TaxID=2653132 RepID=UPI0012F0AA07|nr:hypothetical protein [Arthrobacter sp. 9V]VXB67171.1 hypothetical protein ARTHRO9V_1640048 [Arthrobacter sp. 9V]